MVMITYGHESYIKQAIESVLMQECDFDVELVIANDCSPDGTNDVVKDIIDHHPKSSWIKYSRHRINKGMTPNFLWALEQSKGKYIALCEGDDFWTDPLKLQNQVDYLRNEYSISGVYHKTLILSSGDLRPFRFRLPKKVGTKEMFNYIIPFHTSSVMLRSSVVKDLPKEFLSFASADFPLFFWSSLSGDMHYLNIEPSIYRKHEGGITMTSEHNGIIHHLNRIKMMSFFNYYTKNKYYDIYKNILVIHLVAIIKESKISLKYLIVTSLKNQIKTWKLKIKKR